MLAGARSSRSRLGLADARSSRSSGTGNLARSARRSWGAVCAGLLAGLAGGGIALGVVDPVYSSSTSVLVQPVGGTEVNLETEAQLARSTETAVAAVALLREPVPAGAIVEPAAVEVLTNTSLLVIRYEAATPPSARAGARALAEAYLANRAAAAQSAIRDQSAALTTKIAEFHAQVVAVNARIATLPDRSAELANLRSTGATLTTQITTLTTRSNELATTTINPGRVVQQADLPAAPVRPYAPLYLTLAGAAGVVVAVALTVARNRLSRHVRDGADIARRAGLTVLAELTGDGMHAAILPPYEPMGRAFHRLRNEVVAALGPDDRVILITGASPGTSSTIVAANLAAALARADNEVVLVGANGPQLGADAVPLSHLFDVADIPGLTDVLTRRTSLTSSLQPTPRSPRLRIVTPGGTATAGGLLQSEGVRAVLDALRRQARYVVVEAPSTAAGADAQSLAGVADATIVVAETGRSRHGHVADAAVQLRLMGTRLLGAVVVPRMSPPPAPTTPVGPVPPAKDGAEPWADVWLGSGVPPAPVGT